MAWPAARARLNAAVLDTFGEPAEYRPASGTSEPLTAIFNRGVDLVDELGQIYARGVTVTLPSRPLAEGDAIAFGATEYRIEKVLADNGGLMRVLVR